MELTINQRRCVYGMAIILFMSIILFFLVSSKWWLRKQASKNNRNEFNRILVSPPLPPIALVVNTSESSHVKDYFMKINDVKKYHVADFPIDTEEASWLRLGSAIHQSLDSFRGVIIFTNPGLQSSVSATFNIGFQNLDKFICVVSDEVSFQKACSFIENLPLENIKNSLSSIPTGGVLLFLNGVIYHPAKSHSSLESRIGVDDFLEDFSNLSSNINPSIRSWKPFNVLSNIIIIHHCPRGNDNIDHNMETMLHGILTSANTKEDIDAIIILCAKYPVGFSKEMMESMSKHTQENDLLIIALVENPEFIPKGTTKAIPTHIIAKTGIVDATGMSKEAVIIEAHAILAKRKLTIKPSKKQHRLQKQQQPNKKGKMCGRGNNAHFNTRTVSLPSESWLIK